MAAVAAAQAQEAVRQDAAVEEGLELVLDELRQAGAGGIFGLGKEDSSFWSQVLGESKDQDHLVEALEKTQSDLLPYLKKLKFKLEDAVELDPALLEKILNEIENDVLCMGLASCDSEIAGKFLNVLNEKRRELVSQQITSFRASPKEALASARQSLTKTFREFLA